MANLNRIFLMGNLTKDPELKFTPQGTAVCTFSLAVNRTYKGADGEQKKEVSFFNIVVWGKQGENCSKYLAKGRPVHIEGRLVIRSYDNKEGQKRYITEIVAVGVQFLGSGGGERQTGNSSPAGGDEYQGSGPGEGADEVPF